MYQFFIDGKSYASNEHYYQSQKFVGNALEDIVRKCKTPKEAKTLAAIEHAVQSPDFHSRKCDVMYKGLRAKFEQNLEIQEMLLNTGEQMLIENSDKDYFWGCGADMTGLNMCGRLLMRVRTELREEKRIKDLELPTLEEWVNGKKIEHRVTRGYKKMEEIVTKQRKRKFYIQLSKELHMYVPSGGGIVQLCPGSDCDVLITEEKLQNKFIKIKESMREHYLSNPQFIVQEEDQDICYIGFEQHLDRSSASWHINYKTNADNGRVSKGCYYVNEKPLFFDKTLGKTPILYTEHEGKYFFKLNSVKRTQAFYDSESNRYFDLDVALADEIDLVKKELEKMFNEEIEYELLIFRKKAHDL